MESRGKKKPRPRRSFTPGFKAEIVELCRRGDRSVGQVARDFDPTETAVRGWVRQAEVDNDERDGLTSSEREEPARLRRENRQGLFRPFHGDACGPTTGAPSERWISPARRSCTYSRSRSSATSFGVFERRATSSAFHCAIEDR